MTEIEQKYYSVREVSQIYALKPAVIRAYCHAKGQSFAYQMVKSGKLLIDLKKFDKWFNMFHAQEGAIRR